MRIARVVAACVLLLAGCTSSDLPPQAVPTITPSIQTLNELARRAPCDPRGLVRHDAGPAEIADFAAVAVISCSSDQRVYPGEGVWTVVTRRIATVGLQQLLSALKRPDDRPSYDGDCGDHVYGPLPYVLTDGSAHYLWPRMPRDGCGDPQSALVEAEGHLRWRVVVVERVNQEVTPRQLRSGCPAARRHEFTSFGEVLGPATGGPAFPRAASSKRKVCVYRTLPAQDRPKFVRAVRLFGFRAHSLDLALSRSGPTGRCAPVHSFAIVFGGDAAVQVELGGCWRVLRRSADHEVVGTASPNVLRNELRLR